MDTTRATLSFGHWLREHRKNLDLTQEELAQRIGCSDNAIRKIEAGTRRPSRQIAVLLADLFQIPTEERVEFIALARGADISGERQHQLPYDSAPASASEPAPSSNLPAQLTRLIGRDEVATEIGASLLQEQTHLVTLTGPPGVGKTRLALRVASDLDGRFGDGVFLVLLAPISDPNLVALAVAQALGIRGTGSTSITVSLIQYLRDKDALLVLDNFEQVMEAASAVVNILEACPRVKVLATSREPLHIRGEQVLAVPPLQLPDPAQIYSMESLSRSSAVTLFVERAQALQPDFRLTEKNGEAVAAISVRLEGLPLAIELAAASVRIFTPQEIQSRLDSRLKLLSGGLRDLPARQQTLRGAIDWSYALLGEGEQKLFARLSVFTGGFALPAAEAVCNARGDLPFDILDGVESLLDKSLLKREEVLEASRYTMLELIREYALEQLKASGQVRGEGSLRRLHAEYFLALAESAVQAWSGVERPEWLRVVEAESGNLRSAFSWALREDAEIAGRLSSALWGYWYNLGRWHEGLSWAKAVVDRGEAVSPETLAWVLNGGGTLAWVMEDYPLAREYNEKSLSIARRYANKKQIARSLRILGSVERDLGDYVTAGAHYAESLALSEEIDDTVNKAYLLNSMGESARSQGQYGRALELYAESLELMRSNSDFGGIRICLSNMARVRHIEGNYETAATLFREVLHRTTRFGDKLTIAESMGGLGGVARARGDTIRAARIFAAVNSILEATNQQFYPLDRKDYEGALEMARRMLDKESWEQAWAEGRAMTLEQAIAYALEE